MKKKAKKAAVKKMSARSTAVKAAPNKKREAPAVNKGNGQSQKFANILNKKREDILDTVRQKEADMSYGDIGDEADVASQTFEREMMFELTNGERMILDDIEAALRKVEKGDFGICENCKKKISIERLNAMPWARYCIECQSKSEAPS
jgi:DnaK suppressor protein